MAQCVASLTQQKIILGTTLLSIAAGQNRNRETKESGDAEGALWCFGKKAHSSHGSRFITLKPLEGIFHHFSHP